MNNTKQPNIRNLIAACAGITVFGLAFGMSYPLLSLILESRGVSAKMIGINSAMMPIGILLFSSIIPVVAKKYGSRNVAVAAAAITAVIGLTYKQFDTLEAWFIIRLLQGMSISSLFVLSEAWIVKFSGDLHRGKVIAIYGSILSASFGAGPALVSWIGIEGWTPFLIGSAIILAGILPLMLIREQEYSEESKSDTGGIFSFASKAPMLLACVLAFSVLDAATLSLLPVYGVYTGLDVSTAALALTALIVGNVVLQFPVGWLADVFPHRALMASLALFCALMLLILPWVMATPWMWPVLVLAGASGYGIYTVSLTALGARFKGPELINGAAAFAVMWGVGALVGSISGGWAMDSFGPHGLPFHLVAVFILLVVGLAGRGYQLSRR